MQNYDCLFLLPGTFSESEVPGLSENLKNLATEAGAENFQSKNLGRQKLSYPVKTSHFGYLLSSTFALSPEKVALLKSKLSLEPTLLRFMLTIHQTPETARPAYFPSAVHPVSTVKTTEKVDLQEIDKKIEEILQSDNLVV